MIDVEPVIDTLLNIVVEIVLAQLPENLPPAPTVEQNTVLYGRHSNITDHLVNRFVKAHADRLCNHIAFSGVLRLAGELQQSSRRPSVGFLTGPLDISFLAGFLASAKEDLWLVVCQDALLACVIRLQRTTAYPCWMPT